MLKILPNITFGQNQITQKPRAATAPTLERTPKHDCVSFGNYNFLNAEEVFQRYASQAKKLTLSDNLIKPIINEYKLYELPMNFFFAMQNAPSRHLIEKIPAVVQDCGLPINTALQKLDKMANILRIAGDYIQIPKFKLGNKTLWSSPAGRGDRGTVYQFISRKENLAFKVFSAPTMIANHGLFGEAAIAREFANAGTIDTPELYIASPHQHTGWMMTEFIDSSTKKPKEGLLHEKFLSAHGLEMGDSITKNYINDSNGTPIRVDLGGVNNGRSPLYIPLEIKTALFQEANPQEAFNDEGTLMSAIKKHLIRFNNIDSNKVKDALQTPEGRFASEMYNTYSAQDENIESALRDIDVVGSFTIN